MDLGQEHGHLQDLSSPILNKLQQGFRDMRNCLDDNSEGAFEHFESLEGDCCGAVPVVLSEKHCCRRCFGPFDSRAF